MDLAVLGVRLLLAAVFAVAAVAKLLDLEGSRNAMRGFGVRDRTASVLGLVVPVAELSVAAALVLQPTARWGAVGAVVLLLAFSAGIVNALRRGQKPDCHCFGQLHSAPAGRETLGRNLGLAVLAGFAVWQGPGPNIGDWVAARTPAELVAIGTGMAALALIALSLRLWADKRKLGERLARAYSALDKVPVGPPVGTSAPGFALAAARGEGRSLNEFRDAGLPVLLLFVDPQCGPCRALLPDVGRWQTTLAQRLPIVVIGSGKHEQLRHLSERHAVHILMEEGSEVFEAYRLRDTPSAVLVGADGIVASQPLQSAFQIEGLIRVLLRRGGPGAQERGEGAAPADSADLAAARV
jgi:uncharacterized membrane protein YphA (DoxX/SURF4 family)